MLKGKERPQDIKLSDVVLEFFKQNTSVSFVVVLDIIDHSLKVDRILRPRLKFNYNLHTNEKSRYPIDEQQMHRILDGFSRLPPPESSVPNAINWLRYSPRQGRPYERFTETIHYPRMKMKVGISARMILDVLAGWMTQEEFAAQLQNGEEPHLFARARNSGFLIRTAQLHHLADEDDDIIELELSGPDPAVAPLRWPSPNTSDDEA